MNMYNSFSSATNLRNFACKELTLRRCKISAEHTFGVRTKVYGLQHSCYRILFFASIASFYLGLMRELIRLQNTLQRKLQLRFLYQMQYYITPLKSLFLSS